MSIQQKILFTGGLNLEVDSRYLPEGSYGFAQNTRVGTTSRGDIGNVENVLGNIEVPFDMPTGTNFCLGAYEVKGENSNNTLFNNDSSCIYFVYNTQGNHGIYRYSDLGNQIECIMRDPALGFTAKGYIPPTSVTLIDNLLGWTDGENEGRLIDVEKASRSGKRVESCIYFGLPEPGINDIFTNGQEFQLSIFDINGGVVFSGTIITADGTYINDRIAGAKAFVSAFNSNGALSNYDSEVCGPFVKISQRSGLGSSNNYEITSFVLNVSNGTDALLVDDNIYPNMGVSDVSEGVLKRAKTPPPCHPIATYEHDPSRNINRLDQISPQFRYRYVFQDSGKSTWSPISPIPDLKVNCSGDQASSFNCIDIDFTRDVHVNNIFMNDVKRIDIAFRDGELGEWALIRSIGREDFGLHRGFIKFYNDETYPILDQIETSKLFDSMPLVHKTEAIVTPQSGDGSRVMLAGTVEGYENICPDATLSLDQELVESCSGTYDVDFTVIIENYAVNNSNNKRQAIHKQDSNTHPTWGGIGADFVNSLESDYQQVLPANGWIGYLAGTDYRATTLQNEPSSTQTYQDGVNNIYSSESVGNRNDIQASMAAEDIWSTGVIKGVKPGKYILRLASHWCSDGDVLGKGSMYDLGNGRAYQTTSTHVAYVDGVKDQHEIVIDLPDIPSGTTASISAGEFAVQDLSDPRLITGSRAVTGYIIDAGGSSDPEDIKTGFRMEKQAVVPIVSGIISASSFGSEMSDHNGFFFFSDSAIAGNRNLFVGATLLANPGGAGFLSGNHIHHINHFHYQGGLSEVANGTLSIHIDNMDPGGSQHQQYIIYNHNPDYECHMAPVSGRVIDQNGAPVSGVTVAIANGRTAITDSKGEYRILVIAENSSTLTSRRDDIIAIGNGSACCMIMGSQDEYFVSINPMQCPDYSMSSDDAVAPLRINDFVVSLNDSEYDGGRWKMGDNVMFGITYHDMVNRSGFVQRDDTMHVFFPYWNEDQPNGLGPDGYKTVVNWEINHPAPNWATHYQWVRTRGELYGQFVQLATDDVKYVIDYDSDTETFTETSYTASDANELYISTKSLTYYFQEHRSSQLAYVFNQGDRLRFIRDDDGVLLPEVYDLPIKGQEGDYVIIDNQSGLPEILEGFVIELYTPKSPSSEKIFYEFGECYEIEQPGGIGFHIHKGPTQDQVYPGTPATGTFDHGNVYFRPRKMKTTLNSQKWFIDVEDPAISDFYASTNQSIGRPNTTNKDAAQVFRKSHVRFSNNYESYTSINGLSSFEALNGKTFPSEMGIINALVWNKRTLLAIGENETISIYIGQTQIRDSADQSVIAIGNEIIGSWNQLIGGFGTRNPESIATHDGNVYWLDIRKKKVVRYSSNGLFPISEYGIDRFIQDVVDLRGENKRASAVFDDEYGEYILSYGDEGGFTLGFHEEKNVWNSFYSFFPDCYCRVAGNNLISFKFGTVWKHNQPSQYNNFYGVQYPQLLAFACNIEQSMEKVFTNTSIDARYDDIDGGLWEAIIIETKTSDQKASTSTLAEGDFELLNGKWCSDFWMDIESEGGLINGDPLRGHYLLMMLQNNNPGRVQTYEVNIYSIPSPRSNF